MILAQGWLHALILAHLLKHAWPTLPPARCATVARILVEDADAAWSWLLRASPGGPGHGGSAERAYLRSIHRDAWAS